VSLPNLKKLRILYKSYAPIIYVKIIQYIKLIEDKSMKLDIPKTVEIECPSCNAVGHSIDDYDITTCGSCGLEIHKDELIEANKPKIRQKINIDKIKKDLVKDLQKRFKNFK
jgi:protein PhnA